MNEAAPSSVNKPNYMVITEPTSRYEHSLLQDAMTNSLIVTRQLWLHVPRVEGKTAPHIDKYKKK